jgi:hypothetical protein
MQRKIFCLLLGFTLWSQNSVAKGLDGPSWYARLTQYIPRRPRTALTGSEFARGIKGMEGKPREQAVLEQLLEGNLPEFLRTLRPVFLNHTFEDGRSVTATIFVMPDYLAVGSNSDFVRIPMNLYTASEVANRFGFVLPTKKMVDAIYEQSVCHFRPEPMTPGPRMSSTAYYIQHNQRIRAQRLALGSPLGELASGHKKDVVLTKRLSGENGKIAIYGWHRTTGSPIQPLSMVHGASYADYSHGIRLVSDIVLIEDEPHSICNILKDPELSKVLNDEGPIPDVLRIMGGRHDWASARLESPAAN